MYNESPQQQQTQAYNASYYPMPYPMPYPVQGQEDTESNFGKRMLQGVSPVLGILGQQLALRGSQGSGQLLAFGALASALANALGPKKQTPNFTYGYSPPTPWQRPMPQMYQASSTQPQQGSNQSFGIV